MWRPCYLPTSATRIAFCRNSASPPSFRSSTSSVASSPHHLPKFQAKTGHLSFTSTLLPVIGLLFEHSSLYRLRMAELGDLCDDASLRKVLALLAVLRLSNRDLGTVEKTWTSDSGWALEMYVAYRTKIIDSYASRKRYVFLLCSFLFSYGFRYIYILPFEKLLLVFIRMALAGKELGTDVGLVIQV